MTPAALAFWSRANRRAASLTPDLARALLRAFQIIRETVPETQLAAIVASGNIDQLFQAAFTQAVFDRAFAPVREQIRSGVASSVRYFARDLPKAGKVNGVLSVGFDILNPRVIDAVRALDTRVVTTLQGDVRETVRAFVENGLRDGVNPRTVARDLRQVIGLAPNQEQAVRNFRRMLETGDREALTRALRDKRFDRTLEKALGKDGAGLTAKQIDTMVDANRRRAIANNAETNARTASLDSMKLGQRLSWQDAVDKGIVDGDRLMKQRIGVDDGRERPEHVAINNEIRRFDEPYSNGEMVSGDSSWCCRCTDRYFQARG